MQQAVPGRPWLKELPGSTWEQPWSTDSGQQEAAALGKSVQVDPIKPTLEAPGTKRLNLKSDKLLSSFAFKINLRRYSWGPTRASCRRRTASTAARYAPTAYTPPRFESN